MLVPIIILLKLSLYAVGHIPFLRMIFSVKEQRDLETECTGRSRSLKMAPSDRSYTTFYWSAIVSIAACCIPFSSYLPLNNRDLKMITQLGHSN